MFQDFSLTALTKTERERKKTKQIVMAFVFSMEMIYSAEYILNPVCPNNFCNAKPMQSFRSKPNRLLDTSGRITSLGNIESLYDVSPAETGLTIKCYKCILSLANRRNRKKERKNERNMESGSFLFFIHLIPLTCGNMKNKRLILVSYLSVFLFS